MKTRLAINDLTDSHMLAHLLKYDSNYGQYNRQVGASDGAIIMLPIKTFGEGATPKQFRRRYQPTSETSYFFMVVLIWQCDVFMGRVR